MAEVQCNKPATKWLAHLRDGAISGTYPWSLSLAGWTFNSSVGKVSLCKGERCCWYHTVFILPRLLYSYMHCTGAGVANVINTKYRSLHVSSSFPCLSTSLCPLLVLCLWPSHLSPPTPLICWLCHLPLPMGLSVSSNFWAFLLSHKVDGQIHCQALLFERIFPHNYLQVHPDLA